VETIISGRHVDITPALKDYTRERAGKLTKYFNGITKIVVTLASESGRQSAEMIISARRNLTLIGVVEDRDLYAAIDLVTDKMERQLTKWKEKIRDHRGQPAKQAGAAGGAPAGAPDEAEDEEDVGERGPQGE
jgi:putative sigma-54 modulation protein